MNQIQSPLDLLGFEEEAFEWLVNKRSDASIAGVHFGCCNRSLSAAVGLISSIERAKRS